MTTIGGRPGLPGAGAAAASHGRSAVSMPRSSQLRTVLALARVESSLLLRSMLVLAGLLAGGATIWILLGAAEPLWWNAAWKIGFGQLVLGAAVLVAAQLGAGRARRDGMADLYASFPATAGTRTLGHLIGVAGVAPASVLLVGAAAIAVQARGAIGAPSIMLLAGGLVLVITAGAVGVAIGTRFAHPLAGLLGALALLLSSGTSHTPATGAGIWLLPWEGTQDQVSSLPGPLAGYPPAGAHVLELAGIAALAIAVALRVSEPLARAPARRGLTVAGIAAVAVTCLAGVLQLLPIPPAQLDRLVTEIADPPAGQHCTTVNQVSYCIYPGFGSDLPSLEAPVNGVLEQLPARAARPLTISQSISLDLDATFLHGQSGAQVSRWRVQLQRAPQNTSTASAIYLSVGSWPAGGGYLADARFQVALAVADWAVHLPFPINNGQPCVPLDQAREAIAIWLAMHATHSPAGEFSSGLTGPGGGPLYEPVGKTIVAIWNYPGASAGYLNGLLPQFTAAGYQLANAMARMPAHKIIAALDGGWATWLKVHSTDAQLALALGIPVPSVPTARAQGPTTGPGGPGSGPQSSVCTA
jgi:hypothetical protein